MKGTGYDYLGIPYWDRTRDATIPDIFDNLKFPTAVDRMLDLKSERRRPEGIFAASGLTRNLSEWTYSWNGSDVQKLNKNGHLMYYDPYSEEYKSMTHVLEDNAKICQNGLRIKTNPLSRDRMYHSVRKALTLTERNASDFSEFSKSIEEESHTWVHMGLKCAMKWVEITAYDPVFWMHHAFVDKIFATWQLMDRFDKRKQSFEDLVSPGSFQPFNNRTYNDFFDITNIPAIETWDYRENLSYGYDYLEDRDSIQRRCRVKASGRDADDLPFWKVECNNVSAPSHIGELDKSLSEVSKSKNPCQHLAIEEKDLQASALSIRLFVAIVVPHGFGGSLRFKFCRTDKECFKRKIEIFGSLSGATKVQTRVNSQNFVLRRVEIDAYKSNDVPTSTPEIMLWENVALRRKYKTIVPVDPFIIHRVHIKGKDMVKDIAQLLKGVDPKQYGDLLANYEVKKFCDTMIVNENITWDLGTHCN